MDNYALFLIIIIFGYNLALFIYCVRTGIVNLSKKNNIPLRLKYKVEPPSKYSVYEGSFYYNISNELHYIYDGTRWLNEIEITNFITIISNNKVKKYKKESI